MIKLFVTKCFSSVDRFWGELDVFFTKTSEVRSKFSQTGIWVHLKSPKIIESIKKIDMCKKLVYSNFNTKSSISYIRIQNYFCLKYLLSVK